MKSAIVIPARLASTRLERKLLLSETGKSLIQHTYESASQSKKAEYVLVAADHPEILQTVTDFGGNVVMTDPDHQSGTDRVAEVAQSSKELFSSEIIVNVQGDEPEIPGDAIDLAVSLLEQNPQAMIATLATPIRTKEQLDDPNCVKVVFDGNQRAMYFSRSPIPRARSWNDALLAEEPAHWHQHIGLYAYRRDFLLNVSDLPRTRIEEVESLEQLRFLHAGYPILVGVIDHPIVGIDTPADYQRFVERQST